MVPDSARPLALGMACPTWVSHAAYGRQEQPIIYPYRPQGHTYSSTLPRQTSKLIDNLPPSHTSLHPHHSHCLGLKARLTCSAPHASGASIDTAMDL